jgi:cyclase
LVFYDITASADNREVMLDVVRQAANEVFIPLSVGGGLRSVDDMARMLNAGADKVSINTAAVENPALIEESARAFGSQCVVLGLDAIKDRESPSARWDVRVRTGDGSGRPTKLDAVEWAARAAELGAGEIVVNSMDEDGRRKGYDLALNRTISEAVGIPVVASGGAGGPEHMYDALVDGRADAVLAASIFHFGVHRVADAKEYLSLRGVPLRPIEAG